MAGVRGPRRIGEHVLNQRSQRFVVRLYVRSRELLGGLQPARPPDTRRFPVYPKARGDLLVVCAIGGHEDGLYPAHGALRVRRAAARDSSAARCRGVKMIDGGRGPGIGGLLLSKTVLMLKM